MDLISKPQWPRNQTVGIQPIGEKNGSKRSLLVDEAGIPLSLVVCGANEHDVTQVEALLDAKLIKQTSISPVEENLCADAGYVGEVAHKSMTDHGYTPHVRSRGEEAHEKSKDPKFKPRRWVVEVAHSWFTRFRKLLVRFEKTHRSYIALPHLAAAIITLRKCGFIYG